ncbi:MAG: tRNA preQ1(34) S-adenosylmethionine ribosyltransferase-isomerase QueA [Spirochaetaceae bacterium]|jgi:S-adenosylmethionine:tRNA ribosyltransferase-isomerase|nr:tRNA preQ1(34) S-adenosylmethionine ribosyltransferase-isomerase QueA [Spirochaetaceae bacterium]
MITADFSFDVPSELIAQHPLPERENSRLLFLDRRTKERRGFRVSDLPGLLPRGSLLVFNNTRVRKASLYGIDENTDKSHKFLLLEESLKDGSACWKALCRRASKRKAGSRCRFPGGLTGEITGCWTEGAGVHGVILRFNQPVDDAYLDRYGRIPLPPYIRREDSTEDAVRYQTVYARETGSAAAPTAGLHFTERLLTRLHEAGIESAFVTLHVGLGTFQPVRAPEPSGHSMHEERYNISEEAAARIEKAKNEGRAVIAAGTTSARALESACFLDDGSRFRIKSGAGTTRIFMYGDYRFKAVDGLFTNFHTPFSTLLMLVSCFAGQFSTADEGRKLILDTYAEAAAQRYRFFSYGDAMLIL